jgi:tetratricopeptide (TPR) repeat protein
MKSFRIWKTFLVICFLLCLSQFGSRASAATATDYYNAGLQLYNAKNYDQAIKYFSAAIQLDPNNLASLQGLANCYYIQGQYSQALADYQKVQTLSPSPQLSALIQSIQTKAGANPAPAVAPPLGGSFDQGVALYQQKQIPAAIDMFQRAVQENPNDPKAYYYLGVLQAGQGDAKDGAYALGMSNKLQPNPGVAGYVERLKEKISPEDRQWVEGRLASGPAKGVVASKKSFGVRLQPAFSMLSLTDFNTNAQSLQTAVSQAQAFDPTVTYTGLVPQGSLHIAIEPVLPLGSDLEVGLPLSIFPVGTASDSVTDSIGALNFKDSMDISAFSVGLNARYLFPMGDLKPFIALGALVEPISVNWSFSQSGAGGVTTATGTFSGMAIGGQFQLGADWSLGDTFSVSPFVGYEVGSASPLTGNFSYSYGGTSQGYSGQLEMEPLPSGGSAIYANSSNFTPPSGSRALQVDLAVSRRAS